MRDICERLFSDECLIGDAITINRDSHGGALDIIDTVADVHGVPWGISDFNRCSCGAYQKCRVERRGEVGGMNL